MAKVVILLLFVLVASEVDAIYRRDQLKSLQKLLKSYYATEIGTIEEKYNTIKSIIRAKSEILYNIYKNSVYIEASRNVYGILSKGRKETRKLIIQTQRIHGTKDCREIGGILYDKAIDFLSHVYRCIDGLVIEGNERISDMKSKYERLHSGLISCRNRFSACLRKIKTNADLNTNVEVDEANMCMKTIKDETTWFIAESVPHVFAHIDSTSHFLSAYINPTYLATCSNGYADFQKEAAELTGRAKLCYQQKMYEAAVRRSRNKAAKGVAKPIL